LPLEAGFKRLARLARLQKGFNLSASRKRVVAVFLFYNQLTVKVKLAPSRWALEAAFLRLLGMLKTLRRH